MSQRKWHRRWATVAVALCILSLASCTPARSDESQREDELDERENDLEEQEPEPDDRDPDDGDDFPVAPSNPRPGWRIDYPTLLRQDSWFADEGDYELLAAGYLACQDLETEDPRTLTQSLVADGIPPEFVRSLLQAAAAWLCIHHEDEVFDYLYG